MPTETTSIELPTEVLEMFRRKEFEICAKEAAIHNALRNTGTTMIFRRYEPLNVPKSEETVWGYE